MRISKNDVPVKIDVPGATARQQPDFGDANGCGKMAGEYFSFGAGTDITPLLEGLENNMCQSPHWGYVIQGNLTVSYGDGTSEVISGGDLFYLPPDHTVRAEEQSEIILFSPQHEHCAVLNHIEAKLGG